MCTKFRSTLKFRAQYGYFGTAKNSIPAEKGSTKLKYSRAVLRVGRYSGSYPRTRQVHPIHRILSLPTSRYLNMYFQVLIVNQRHDLRILRSEIMQFTRALRAVLNLVQQPYASNHGIRRLGMAIPHILKGMGNYSLVFPPLGEWRGMGEWIYFKIY